MDIASAVRQSQQQAGFDSHLNYDEITTLPDILQQAVERYGDAPALTSVGHTISYRQLNQLASRFAAWLQQRTELQPGDRLAVQLPNLSQYSIVAYGALKAGLVLVNVNPMYTETELRYQFEHAEVKAVVVFDQCMRGIEVVAKQIPLQHIIIVSPFDLHAGWKRTVMNSLLKLSGKVGRPTLAHHRLADILMLKDLKDAAPIERSSEDMAVLQYTGGTTGVSKPAVLSHHNLVSNMLQSWAGLSLANIEKGTEKMVAPLPMYHIYSFALVITVGVYFGSHTLLIPDPRNINALVKQLKKFHFSVLSGLNTLFSALLKHPHFDEIDFSGVKIITSGGMALTEGVATEWQQRTGVAICEGYGLTETSPVIAVTPANAVVAGSVGLILPETEVRVVDSEEQDVLAGEHGEQWVRGPQVMKGYWKQPEATAQAIHGGPPPGPAPWAKAPSSSAALVPASAPKASSSRVTIPPARRALPETR